MSAPETSPKGPSRLFIWLYQRPALATRLCITIATSVFAIYARLWLGDKLGIISIFITFYPTFIIVSLICGFRLGLLALSMFIVSSDYYLFEPKSSFKIPDTSAVIELLIFCGTCLAISVVSELMYRAHEKILENERKQAQQALRESDERFRAIVTSAMDAIIALDTKQNIILFNRAAEAMFGCKAEEVIGTSIDRFIPERFRAAHREDIKRFGESGATTRMGRPGEVCGVRTDGEEFPIEASTSQLALDDKRIFTVILRDITERKRAEIALKDANSRKDEFLSTLAHELRNPLAPIRNGLAVLRRSGGKGENAERVQEMMERQVDHLIRLVDDLLEISRISHGKIELHKERVDLATVIEHAVEMNRDLVDGGGLELRVGLPDEPLLLEADAVRLTQVIANLVNNAAKYTEPGGRIDIAAEHVAGQAVVSVADTGVGIAKDMLPRVFDLFTQASDTYARSKAGLGIGLALVRNLIELHGGTVEAHSEGEGRGSRFVVRLPLSSKIEASAPPSKTMTSPAIASRRVLIVDDTPDVACSLALLLETLGANVRVAYSGAEGIATCAEFAPEVVFLDVGMPRMDGFETARRMRELPAGKKATLVALTGWGEEETRRRVMEAGFDRHLIKPADLGEVEMLLDSGLQATPRVS